MGPTRPAGHLRDLNVSISQAVSSEPGRRDVADVLSRHAGLLASARKRGLGHLVKVGLRAGNAATQHTEFFINDDCLGRPCAEVDSHYVSHVGFSRTNDRPINISHRSPAQDIAFPDRP